MLLNRAFVPDPVSSISVVEDDFNVYSRLVLGGFVCLLFFDTHPRTHTDPKSTLQRLFMVYGAIEFFVCFLIKL